MKKVIFILLVIITLVPGSWLFSQPVFPDARLPQEEITGNLARPIGDTSQPSPFENANHFLMNEWHKGALVLEGGSRLENVNLKYNAFSDQLYVYNNLIKKAFIADKETVESFEINNQANVRQVFKKFYSGEKEQQARYYRVLFTGKHFLLAFHRITEAKTSLHTDVFGVVRDTEFRKTVTYYMYESSSGYRKILPKRKSFLSLSQQNKLQLKNLFKKYGIRNFDEDEMIKAIGLMEAQGFLWQ